MLKQCCTVVSPTCSHQAEDVHIPALPNAEGPVLRLHVSCGAPGGVHNHHSASHSSSHLWEPVTCLSAAGLQEGSMMTALQGLVSIQNYMGSCKADSTQQFVMVVRRKGLIGGVNCRAALQQGVPAATQSVICCSLQGCMQGRCGLASTRGAGQHALHQLHQRANRASLQIFFMRFPSFPKASTAA